MTDATPPPFAQRTCPNCHVHDEHHRQTVHLRDTSELTGWRRVIGWCCSQCGHVHVDAQPKAPTVTP